MNDSADQQDCGAATLQKVSAGSPTTDKYPFRCGDYYFRLVDHDNLASDPIARQCVPDEREIIGHQVGGEDFFGEPRQTPVPYLIHRYPDRVVVLATNQCPVLCRFCFRKRRWPKTAAERDTPNANDLRRIVEYLRANPGIREVIISGGDPLTLEDDELAAIIQAVGQSGRISIIRIATRSPATFPQRITAELAAMLGSVPGLWLVTHFNHPRELTGAAMAACHLLIKAGIPVLNQTVLLAGVNDNADILQELFSRLAAHRVKPHYLFHVDPVAGAAHFATGIGRGIEIMRQLRHRLSSIATPSFAIDLPEGGGKVVMVPDYQTTNGKFQTIDGREVAYPFK